MNPGEEFKRRLQECPLIAIIRGVAPADAEAIGTALYDAGIRIIEVPLNSPQPLESINILAKSLADRALIGAGTVLDPEQVQQVRDAGGQLVVSPSTDVDVITATVAAGMVSSPGYFTPSEAFMALKAGAHALKLFPAEAASPAVVKAQKAILPKDVPLLIVGGISPGNMHPYLEAGATGFGLGTGLYKPGQKADETRLKARAYLEALRPE